MRSGLGFVTRGLGVVVMSHVGLSAARLAFLCSPVTTRANVSLFANQTRFGCAVLSLIVARGSSVLHAAVGSPPPPAHTTSAPAADAIASPVCVSCSRAAQHEKIVAKMYRGICFVVVQQACA